MRAGLKMAMKARQRLTVQQQRQAQKLLDDDHEKTFRRCADDITQQCLITVFWTLATNYGWGAGRLRKLADALHDTQDLMNNPSPLHHKFSPLELEQIIKEKYKIDIRAEFKAQVEVKY